MLGYILVIDLAWRLSICWIVYSWIFWPFHHSFAPYYTVDYIIDSWIRQTRLGIKPYVFVKLLIWILAIRALVGLSLIWDVNFSWVSSQTPIHCVASLLNKIFSMPTLIFVFGSCLLSRCWWDLEKKYSFRFWFIVGYCILLAPLYYLLGNFFKCFYYPLNQTIWGYKT